MEISENGIKAINMFIAWINECKKNNLYKLHYTIVPNDKNEYPPFAFSFKDENCISNITLSRFFITVMVINFVSPHEMKNLSKLAHSKGYWLTDNIKKEENK